jgi:hypothetical protein
MFKALLIKEWVQLRALRWVGFLLGVLLTPFVMATTEAARRGWLPFGSVSSYSVRDLLLTAIPALTIALWGLLVLLLTCQAFAADRSNGTESFLLERPVPRSRIWLARLLAALASTVVLIVSHALVLAGLTQIVVSPNPHEWGNMLTVLGVGLLVAGVGFLSGVAAASLLRSPIQAVLLGIVLAAIPPAIASLLGGLFPMAAIFLIPIGFVIPWLLLAAYPVASYRMNCWGEPAGRGRIKRGLWILGGVLAAVPLLFLVLAPIVIRAGHDRVGWSSLILPRSGEAGVVGVIRENWPFAGGWLVDVATAEKIRFLPPPVNGMAWRDDGEVVAVVHSSGPFGQLSARTRLDYFSADGSRIGETLEFERNIQWVRSLRWHGDSLLAAAMLGPSSFSVLIISPEREIREIEIEHHVFTWKLIGPTENGEVFVYRVTDPEKPSFVLQRLDLERGVLDPEPVLEEEAVPTYAGKWMSPSGRYWLRDLGKMGEGMRVVTVETGEEQPLDECLRAQWMTDDRFACLEGGPEGQRLTVGLPGDEREELFSKSNAKIVFDVSPDRERLLVQAWERAPDAGIAEDEPGDGVQVSHAGIWFRDQWWPTGTAGDPKEAWILDPSTGARIDVGSRLDASRERSFLQWAGTDTLALRGPGQVGFLDLEGDGGPRFTFGGP